MSLLKNAVASFKGVRGSTITKFNDIWVSEKQVYPKYSVQTRGGLLFSKDSDIALKWESLVL